MSEVSDPELLRQLNDPASAPGGGDPKIPAAAGGGMKIGDEMDLLRGIGQGLIDPVEGLAQLAEHLAGRRLTPEGLRNWAKDFRNKAQSTYMGIGGEVAGNVAGLAIPGGMLGKAATVGGRIAQGIGEGAAGGLLQPVTGGGDYASTKVRQGVLGTIAGGAGPAIVGTGAKVAPYVVHPKGALLHLFRGGAMPSSTVANLAQQVPRTAYGAGAGMYRGTHPTPAEPDEQPAAAEPPRKTSDLPGGFMIPGSSLYRGLTDLWQQPPAAPPPPPAPRPPAAQAAAGAQSFNRRFKGDDDDGDSE